jgi:hypothetical protein
MQTMAGSSEYLTGTPRVAKTRLELLTRDCDIFLTPHPERFGLHDNEDTDYSCMNYAESANEQLDRRLEQERQ